MANQGTGVTLTKMFSYRGDATEEWSNTYWFGNAAPTSDAEWLAMWQGLWSEEAQVIPSNSKLVQVYGYNDRTYKSHAVYDHPVSPGEAGVLIPPVAGVDFAGDQAACVQWKTNRKNSRGKWIYLRKYLHDGFVEAASPDFLEPSYHTKLLTYADAIRTYWGGIQPGPSKDDPTPPLIPFPTSVVNPWVTTRSLKRRGKRPIPHATTTSASSVATP